MYLYTLELFSFMKKLNTTILLLMCLFCAMGQNYPKQKVWQNTVRDYKSSLDFNAARTSFSISPSGEIWMSDYYCLWHTNGLSSNWKEVLHPYKYAVDFSYVACPDTNTVLVFGRIFDPSDSASRYNKYMRSTDGGKNWDFLPMPYRMEKEKIWVKGHSSGQVWLSIDSILYYSSDKGLHFREIATISGTPFKFDMNDDGLQGIGECKRKDTAGFSRYFLIITRDNWAHYMMIPTPYDQHPEIKSKYLYSFAICHSTLMVKQADRYFRTSIDTIDWQEIPLNIRDIAVDRESGEWVIVTRENLLFRSADLVTFDTVNTFGPCCLTVLKYANKHAVYGMSSQKVIGIFSQGIIDSLYCYTPDGLTACGFYREDIPLVPQYIFFNGKFVKQKLVAGNTWVALASDNDVILYDKKKKKWYRHLKTPFLIEDIQICKGELSGNLLLSDGARQYLVALDTPTITPFHYERPLDDFLKSPVKSVDIVYKFFPCDGKRYEERVLYNLNGNAFFVKKCSLRKNQNDFVKEFPAEWLYKQLETFNLRYDAPVKKGDFGFTQADYDSLRRFMFSSSTGALNYLGDSVTVERVLGILPQLNDSVWTDIIHSYWSGRCTSSSTLEITFQNKAGKSLVISNRNDACGYGFFPYRTPFQVQCGDKVFPCASVPFMQSVSENMPPSMVDRNFSHFNLLMKACRYVLMHREMYGI